MSFSLQFVLLVWYLVFGVEAFYKRDTSVRAPTSFHILLVMNILYSQMNEPVA